MKPTLILVVAAALGLLCVPAHCQATAGTAIPQPAYRTYVVSDAAAFSHLSLPLPASSLLLRNGLPQIPGVDYFLSANLSTFQMALKSLGLGDKITVVSFPGIVTGGSGALDCSTLPFVCDLNTAVVPFKQSANEWLGANDFSAAPFLRLPLGAGLPGGGCALPTDRGKVYVAGGLWLCDGLLAAVPAWTLQGGGVGPTVPAAPAGAAGVGALPIFTSSGISVSGHIVFGTAKFAGYVATLDFSGQAAFTSATSFACMVSDQSGSASAVGITNKSGTTVALTDNAGAGTGSYAYLCVGN